MMVIPALPSALCCVLALMLGSSSLGYGAELKQYPMPRTVEI